MGRKREKDGILNDIFQTLCIAPAWVGPILAGLVFIFFRFVLPGVLGSGGSDPFASTFNKTISMFTIKVAPYAGVVILMLWVAAEITKWAKRHKFDHLHGIDDIRGLSWRDFETQVGEAFRRQGYSVEETGNPAGDGGIDLILRKDGQKTLVQCKQWKAWQVGVKPVRELLGVVTSERADHGIVVTSGRFTRQAQDFVNDNPITLIDGEELAGLIGELRGSKRTADTTITAKPQPAVAALTVQPAAPACPLCKSPMVVRTAKKGASAGSKFWGCTTYPRCHGTRQAD